MELSEIKEADPKKAFVEIVETIKPASFSHPYNVNEKRRIRSYWQNAKHAAESLGFAFEIEGPGFTSGDDASFDEALVEITEMVERYRIDLVVAGVSSAKDNIAIDAVWRDKIHSYVSHIRQVVEAVENISAPLRQSILNRLNTFVAEVDRHRTRVQSFTDVFVGLCEGISEGATALIPAVRLGERIIGALGRLGREPQQLQLPPPEQFNFSNPEEPDESMRKE
jgi:hypothetical protein